MSHVTGTAGSAAAGRHTLLSAVIRYEVFTRGGEIDHHTFIRSLPPCVLDRRSRFSLSRAFLPLLPTRSAFLVLRKAEGRRVKLAEKRLTPLSLAGTKCFTQKCASTQQVPTNTIAAMGEKGRCLVDCCENAVNGTSKLSIAEFFVRTMRCADR